ncbi:MAG TPA: 2-hydroxyglutaryl-CoA dehydratase [Dehalococcoidia bacterium]|nr:2-hydroxyglutaryl-CoA dehydratase [Dehalococcoidia bacterium]
MIQTIGIDIGSLNTKAIVLGDDSILSRAVGLTGDNVESQARKVLDSALSQTGLNLDSLPILATGTGAKLVSFTSSQKSVNTCMARGIHYLYPSVRMVIDMGAESTTVVKVNTRGRLEDWANHDKCASGTGLFLQQMAKLMKLSLEEMSELSMKAKGRADITNTCAVFAESEVISHVHRVPPTPMPDIAAGIYYSVVSRVIALCKRIGIEKDIAVTGGVSLIDGIIYSLESELGFEVLRPEFPQSVAALGAAIIARENAEKSHK